MGIFSRKFCWKKIHSFKVNKKNYFILINNYHKLDQFIQENQSQLLYIEWSKILIKRLDDNST
jgi:hypothetical protein